jgi:hypothetical protein
MHAWGLRLRRVRNKLAIAPAAVWPSVTWYDVGTPDAIISQLNALPTCAPVNASMVALRLATHDSGSGWVATPSLCDALIHDSTPVLSRRTPRAARDPFLTTFSEPFPPLD